LKAQGDRVDAVAFVSRRAEALTLEDVSQVTAAVLASNLNPFHTKGGIFVFFDSTGNRVEERWPPTPRIKLGVITESEEKLV